MIKKSNEGDKTMRILIKGLDKAAVLAALYNAARSGGMGLEHYNPKPMTTEEAAEILKGRDCFDYLNGRVLKIDLDKEEIDPSFYDYDNGEGAADKAIQALRQK